jgi:hypothetical protein
VLPRRLGVRFALEALFLVVLAVAAGLAHLRPLYIVIVMAVAWLLVAAAELTASRIERSPVSYLLPEPTREEEEEQAEVERIFHPRPEERTVVAPPIEQSPAEESEPAAEEAEPAAEEAEPAAEEAEPAAEEAEVVAAATEPAEQIEPDEPEEAEAPAEPTSDEAPAEAAQPGKRRFRLRRRSREVEPAPPPPPRHVKLLPRRSTPEPSRASKEVAELFGSSGRDDEEHVEPEETGT